MPFISFGKNQDLIHQEAWTVSCIVNLNVLDLLSTHIGDLSVSDGCGILLLCKHPIKINRFPVTFLWLLSLYRDSWYSFLNFTFCPENVTVGITNIAVMLIICKQQLKDQNEELVQIAFWLKSVHLDQPSVYKSKGFENKNTALAYAM